MIANEGRLFVCLFLLSANFCLLSYCLYLSSLACSAAITFLESSSMISNHAVSRLLPGCVGGSQQQLSRLCGD